MKKEGLVLLENMSVYTLQIEIADTIWLEILSWNFFEKDTIGKQLARAFDSIGANIAEGFGRYHYGDKIKFYYYARGSAMESQYWLKRAHARGLLDEKKVIMYLKNIQQIIKEINTIIKAHKSTKSQSKS